MTASTQAALTELATLSLARLRAEWRRLHRGQHLPSGLTSTQLVRSIAWRLQEKAQRGLLPIQQRELDRLADQLSASGSLDVGAARKLKPGTRLVRRWHGQAYSVTVLEQGFEYDGRRYKSLTPIAREITGAAWSGPRFFGLKDTGRETA